MRWLKKLPVLLLGLSVLAQFGCETLFFYQQAIHGQWQIMRARQPVSAQLQAGELHVDTLQQLQLAQEILEFAQTRLALPGNGRYRSYVALDRDYVVWNVFAAAPYDLRGKQWCYPVVGCAPYRGYFKQQAAQAAASRYQQQGLETYIGPVSAYSTLGWFKDPLLSSFLNWPEADLVQLLLHELAHSKLWVKGDVAFNEGFATFVGQQGTVQWFHRAEVSTAASADSQALHSQQQAQRQWLQFRNFILSGKQQLARQYSQHADDEQLLAQAKTRTLAALRGCYERHREALGGGRFDTIMANLNNAYLVSLSTYEDWVPAMQSLFAQAAGSWPSFYTAVQHLAELSPALRQQQLLQLRSSAPEQQLAHQAGHQHSQQLDCQ